MTPPFPLLPATIFVGTGVLSTVIAQLLLYGGAGDGWTALLPLANYAGMALASLVPDSLSGNAPAAQLARGEGADGESSGDARSDADVVAPHSTSSRRRRGIRAGGGGESGTPTPALDAGEGGSSCPDLEASSPAPSPTYFSEASSPALSPPTSSTSFLRGGSSGSSIAFSGGGGANADGAASFTAHASSFPPPVAGSDCSNAGRRHPRRRGPPSRCCCGGLRPLGCQLTPGRFVAATIVLDCVGYLLSVYGLLYAGSALFQVLYSSVVVWAALGSWAVAGKALSGTQAAGIALVMAGLALSGLREGGGGSGGSGRSSGGEGGGSGEGHGWSSISHWLSPHHIEAATAGASAEGFASTGGSSSTVLAGMTLSIACAMTYGCVYVLAEAITSQAKRQQQQAAPPRITMPGKHSSALTRNAASGAGAPASTAHSAELGGSSSSSSSGGGGGGSSGGVNTVTPAPRPAALASRVGCGITSLLAVYCCVYVWPRRALWLASVASPSVRLHLSYAAIGGLYACLAACSTAHSLSYYSLMASTGSVATGIMASLRAVGVFLVSGPLFCSLQEAQCLTAGRLGAAIVVLSGVLLYSSAGGGGGGGGKGRGHKGLVVEHATRWAGGKPSDGGAVDVRSEPATTAAAMVAPMVA